MSPRSFHSHEYNIRQHLVDYKDSLLIKMTCEDIVKGIIVFLISIQLGTAEVYVVLQGQD